MEERETNVRVHKKDSAFKFNNLNNISLSDDQINYEAIYENVKEYLVFKISITTDLKERVAYFDVLEYMEQVQLKVNKGKEGENKNSPFPAV